MNIRAAIPYATLLASLTPLLTGCGTPAMPQPPTLYLPNRVVDLTAHRTGSTVTLHWTNPKRTTDRVLLKSPLTIQVCRHESAQPCQPATLTTAEPGVVTSYTDTLPAAEQQGPPRSLTYTLELPNTHGHSAGPSNEATLLAGAAPNPVAGLTAQPARTGIILHWTPDATGPATIRLHRKLITQTPTPEKKQKFGAEPAERELLVSYTAKDPGHAIDTTALRGQRYEYTAERLFLAADKQELTSSNSPAVPVAFTDTFAPIAPTELAAIASLNQQQQPIIDLTWTPTPTPETEPMLAGYNVYRRQANGEWQRLTQQPVPTASYEDVTVQPGQTYEYAITSIGQNQMESPKSTPSTETTPTP